MSVDMDRLRTLILHIANHPAVKDLGTTKLYKIIYFIDAKILREAGASLTGSDFIKYEHGPVPSRGERAIKALEKEGKISIRQRDCGGFQLSEIVPQVESPGVFSSEQKQAIDSVLVELGAHSAKYLSEASHHEPAWVYAGMHEKLDETLMLYGEKEDPVGL